MGPEAVAFIRARLRAAEWQYLGRFRRLEPAAVQAHLQKLSRQTNTEIAAWAAGEINTERIRRDPLGLVFTAADGRILDLQSLRGKVVLVEFWATWCGPRFAEIPNLLANYDKYRDRSFEVIGVSLDRRNDRQKLVDFVTREKLPWPQYFDGDHDKNTLADKYGVFAIPAMFLLDQEGRLVETNVRGAKLESEIRRLLKI